MYLALAQTNVGANLFASCSPSTATNHQQTRPGKSAERGFTLVELIMVIALAGIVAVMITSVLSRPLQGFADQSRRAELTDLAAMALNRMARDIRLAVPNSVKNEEGCLPGNCTTLEFLQISEAGRYRGNQSERFDPPRCPGSGDCLIPVLSPPLDIKKAKWMVIYNTNKEVWSPPSSAGQAVITPSDAEVILGDCPPGDDAGLQCLELKEAGEFSFKSPSPAHRFYLSDGAIRYRCGADGSGAYKLYRAVSEDLKTYSGESTVVDSVTRCSLSYETSINTRNGLVTLHLSLTKGGETVSLLQQVHVDNAP
ncbi:PulJ/GspJ family protein [Stutzerimonas kunmingensis]|uniref:PulJ/GspJ family protein n=1 Tax=Stutzerimonas kunmingensis TaxID=1211807 RepID=UPI00241C17CF|nr:type II secretion system protein [Stutzerimonas kunmingensis]